MDLSPGVVLAGRYRVDRKIGAGGMAEVWAGKNITVGTDVAIKKLHIAVKGNAEVVLRFRREAYLLACVRSDHVARLLDFASDETYGHILVTDLIHGDSLHDVLQRRRLGVEEALDLLADLARGVSDLHRAKVVHRDLKPGNVILEARHTADPRSTYAGARFRAVIVDFGLGRVLRDDAGHGADDVSAITNVDTALGTLEYMAPEQILNSRGATATADIYSLGAILFRAITGHHMFGDLSSAQLAHAKLSGSPPPAVFTTGRADRLARGLEAIVNRALARYPEQRYQRAEDLLAEVTMLMRSEPETSPASLRPQSMAPAVRPGASAAPPPRSPRGEGRGTSPLLLFFTALGAMLIGAIVGSTAERMRAQDQRDRDGPSATATPASTSAAASTSAPAPPPTPAPAPSESAEK